MTIQLLKPSCTNAEVAAVARVLQSGWWGNGPQCAAFERELEAATGYAHAVTVNSCTAALHLALLAAGVGPGDEVILPALTFVSTALAVVYCGATPVFADVLPDSLTLDWVDVQDKITPRTKAIMPVDYAGYPAAPARFWIGPVIVEDAAHMPLGEHYGDTVCLSFHPVKPLATGDGGAILTNDAATAERLAALRWCGIDRSTWQRSGKRYSWDYDIAEVGYKCHLNDIQAAIGRVQLARADELHARRTAIAYRYLTELPADALQLPAVHPAHVWHLFTIRVDADKRDGLLDFLGEWNVQAGVHYKPLTEYAPFLAETPPVTAREWRRLVSLPIHGELTDAEQSRVIEAVQAWTVSVDARQFAGVAVPVEVAA